jgi:hypothetical protein
MRYVSGTLAALLLLFAAAQYNDPDGLFWAVAYGVPALWALIVAAKPALLRRRAVTGLFAACFAAAIGGVLYFWPQADEWWRQDVWWHDEAAREGMGLMIVAGAFVFLAVARVRIGQRAC